MCNGHEDHDHAPPGVIVTGAGLVSPIDVRNKVFSTVRIRAGYNLAEVDSFLGQVEMTLITLFQENSTLSRLAATTPMTVHPVGDSATRLMALAQETADRVIAAAHQEAERIVAEARARAEAVEFELEEQAARLRHLLGELATPTGEPAA